MVKSSDGDSSVRVNLRETENVSGIFILENHSQILTVHETTMMKWDLATGKMADLIRLLPNKLSKSHTIISCCVSSTKKLLLIGSTRGFVAIISIYSGGVVMRCSPKHSNSVIFVGFYKKMIISFDDRGCMFKYAGFRDWTPNNSNDTLSRSKLVQHSPAHSFDEYTQGIIHDRFGILIVGTELGLIRFICLTNDKIILDVDSLKDGVTSMILKQHEYPNKHSLLLTTDKLGNICCWQLPKLYPSRAKFTCKCLYRIQNCDDFQAPITTFCVNTFGKYVVTGDGKGLMKIWCIEEKIKQDKEDKGLFKLTEPEHKEYECKLMKKIQVGSDWVNNIFIVTENALHYTFENYKEENSDMEDDNNNVICMISSSLDGKLFAWRLNGECIGELIYLKQPELSWSVKIDTKKRNSKQLQYALRLFQKMEL